MGVALRGLEDNGDTNLRSSADCTAAPPPAGLSRVGVPDRRGAALPLLLSSEKDPVDEPMSTLPPSEVLVALAGRRLGSNSRETVLLWLLAVGCCTAWDVL